MSKKIKINDLPEFDMAEHLPDEQAVAEYPTMVLEENDPAMDHEPPLHFQSASALGQSRRTVEIPISFAMLPLAATW